MLNYIDAHIREKMSVEKLAARAGFSRYHFCRVFQWGTGYSIMEYVRNRRLAFAASELRGGRKIIDISIDYGFETHSGFTKAFRRYFGCSPEIYRAHASFDVPKLPNIRTAKQYINGGIVMEPKMVRKPAVKLAGFLLRTNADKNESGKAIPRFWTAYKTDGRMQKLHSEPFVKIHTEYGACFPENPENGEFEYVIAVEVKEDSAIPKEYHVCTIPEALFAVFSSPPSDDAGFSPAIQGTWKYIFNEWFPGSGCEFDANGVDYELYDERCQSETAKVCDIYVPVVKKT
ncbi:MAG: AraC family transcriptional regulator [Treponema sp.]|nr:AraC family transcriptional regulator [Treponema sp.]